jgi:hypothetical protein
LVQVSICRLELKCALALPYIFRFPNSAFQMARKGNGGLVPFTGSGHKLSESPDKEVHVVKDAETHDAKTKRMKLTCSTDPTFVDQTLGAEPTPEIPLSFGNPKHQPEPKPERSQPEPIQVDDVDISTQGTPYGEEQLLQLMDMKTMAASWLYRIQADRYAADIKFVIHELIGELTIAISSMEAVGFQASAKTCSSTMFPAWVSSASMEALVVMFAEVKKATLGRLLVDPEIRDEDSASDADTSESEPECIQPPAKRRKGEAESQD